MRSSASIAAQEYSGAPPLKVAAQVALITLLLLAIGGAIFYRLRIFSDTAYIAFKIINEGRLQIQIERYGSAITQIVPLIGAKLGLPLKVILIAYSASFHLFYLGIAAILYFRFRNYPLVLLMGFYYTLVVSATYFWPNCELHQGIAWMFLAIASHQYADVAPALQKWRRIAFYLLAYGLAFLAVFTHPLVMLVFLFLLLFFSIAKVTAFNGRNIAYLILILLATGVRMYLSRQNHYDSNYFDAILRGGWLSIASCFNNGFADVFWKAAFSNYWLLLLLFISTLVVLIVRRRYLLAGYLLLANVGFFSLASLSFYTLSFHVESEIMPFGIFGTAGFVYVVLPHFPRMRPQLALLFAMFLTRLIYILAAAPYFERRYQMVQNVMHEMQAGGQQKLVLLCDESGIESTAVMYWGMPYESMLWSSLDGDIPNRTFLGVSPERYRQLGADTMRHTMLEPWHVLPAGSLNPHYFQLDTTRPYATWDCAKAQEVLRRIPAVNRR